jgi:hypothetical protein
VSVTHIRVSALPHGVRAVPTDVTAGQDERRPPDGAHMRIGRLGGDAKTDGVGERVGKK